jgi:hypothetical protein
LGEVPRIQGIVLRVPAHKAFVEICQRVLLDWEFIFLGALAREVFFEVGSDFVVLGLFGFLGGRVS